MLDTVSMFLFVSKVLESVCVCVQEVRYASDSTTNLLGQQSISCCDL